MSNRLLLPLCLFIFGCSPANTLHPGAETVPHIDRWGIYRLALDTRTVTLIHSSPTTIGGLRLNPAGDRLVFGQNVGGDSDADGEIFTIAVDGTDLRRLTDNGWWDLYPAWSPDGTSIAFLSWRSSSLGIFVMGADGGGQRAVYDSPSHEADIDWQGDQIVFTRDSAVWIMQSDGTGARQLTRPPKAGIWGKANLPFGDYDPRLSPDGSKVVFERLTADQSAYGNYDFFVVDASGANETRITQTGFSQGIAAWSHAGDRIAFIVAAAGDTGLYDLYLMNADGTNMRDITPAYFPSRFLCHWAVFSGDDSALYFIGEWWPAS